MYGQQYIVLIDDDEEDLEILSSGLELKGMKVKIFSSSAKALLYLTHMSDKGELPTLIILDYNMPVKNGYQVLLSLKENTMTRNIPVVMYSTNMSDTLKGKLLAVGALDCFAKPWNYQELKVQVDRFEELACMVV